MKFINQLQLTITFIKQGLDSPSNGNSQASHPSSSENSPLHETRNMPSTLLSESKYSVSTETPGAMANNSRNINGVARRLKLNELNTTNAIHRRSLINLEDVVSSTQQVKK